MSKASYRMQTSSSAQKYLAPRVRVLEIKERMVICQSPTIPADTGGEVDDLG